LFRNSIVQLEIWKYDMLSKSCNVSAHIAASKIIEFNEPILLHFI